MRIDLGGGHAPAPGHLNIDLVPEANIKWDLNKGLPPEIEDNSIEGMRCHHVVEHLHSVIPLLNDCYRVMSIGAELEISTPYAGTVQWYQDPTHVKAFVPESFLYFSKDSPFKKEQGEYGITARFEIVRAERGEDPDDWQLFVVLRK